jgi:hypothetical protein
MRGKRRRKIRSSIAGQDEGMRKTAGTHGIVHAQNLKKPGLVDIRTHSRR